MICSRCRNRLLLRLSGLSHSNRPQASFLHSSTTPDTPSPRQPASQPSIDVNASTPSAISASTPGLSQPLSTPDFPASSRPPPGTPPSQRRIRVPSSVSGGTELKGLAYMKNKPVILAKEDSEYPDWLWGLLEKDDANAEKNDGIDPSSESQPPCKHLSHERANQAHSNEQEGTDSPCPQDGCD